MSMLSLAGTYTISQAVIMPSLMDGRDLVSVNKVSDALCMKEETKRKKKKTLTVLFMDLNQGFVRLLCSGKIVLILHKKQDDNEINLRVCMGLMTVHDKKQQ